MVPFRKLAYRCATLVSALSIVSGCGSSVDPFGPAIDLSLMVMTPSAASSTLHARFGDREVSLSVPGGSISRATKRVRGTGYGDLPARFMLIGSSGDTLATASFTQKLQVDYGYGIGVIVGRERLPSFCSVTVTAVPLRNSASDSMFVDVTGIPNGAIC